MQKGHTMQDVQNNPLGTEKISKLLLKFSVPTFVTLFINSLYNIVDQMFIGNKLGVNGISATNVAFPLLTLTSALALLIGDGCAANISLCLGKKEHDKANQYFGSALIMLIISGCLLAVLSSIFLEPLMYAFGADTRVMPYAMEYTRIILIGLPFSAVNIAFTTIIRADGNPAYTMRSMIIGTIINIILDPLFIFALDMGMTGAALATILGQITTAVLCLSYIPKLQHFKLSKSDLRIRSDICKSILSLGLPSFAMHISNTATQIIMNNLMRTYGGASIYGSTIPLSCYGTLMKLYQIAHSMFVGVCSGTQPINGFNFGAKKYSRVIKTYKYAIVIGFIIASLWYIVFQLLPKEVFSLFVNGDTDPLYYQFAVICSRTYMMAFFIYSLPMITSSMFQAIGASGKSLIITLSRQVFFLIPLSLALSHFLGLNGALYSAPLADVFCFIFAIILAVPTVKKLNSLSLEFE